MLGRLNKRKFGSWNSMSNTNIKQIIRFGITHKLRILYEDNFAAEEDNAALVGA
jgi:hypothetical protein